jgi:hypothetical protein
MFAGEVAATCFAAGAMIAAVQVKERERTAAIARGGRESRRREERLMVA